MSSNLSVEDIKEMFADVARRFQETDRMFKETKRRLQEESERRSQEAERRFQEFEKAMQAEWRETSKKIREVSQQIGGLGNKFGSFTEGLALPSMQKILLEKFGVDTVSPSVRVSRNGKHLEVDVLAYANGEVNTAYVVEVKSHLREDGIEQLLRILDEFAEWFPEHKDKRLFGILAAVDIPEAIHPKVFEQGLYLARIHNDLFELQSAEAFVPRRFDKAALQ